MAPARSRPSASTAFQIRGPAELPEYQPPAHPLNITAQQTLRDLPRSHKLDPLTTRLQTANSHLTDAAAEINDRFQEKNAQNEKRKAKRAALMGSQEESEEAERSVEEMRKATENLTENLDKGIRRVIDGGEEVKVIEKVLQELNANITGGRNGATQSTLGAIQFRQNRRRNNNDADDDENEDVEDDVDEWADEAARRGLVELLKDKIEQHRSAYSESTMTDRYASHNDYVGFKKIVHDAHYPGEEAPPMPHASTWFADGGGTQLPSNNGLRGTQLDDDDDDDLVMESERISVKCPITLTEMKDPVSSKKCPHNFERQAFLEMINNSDVRVDGDGKLIESSQGRRNGGKKAMRCPVAGCDALLQATDVCVDAVLVRKIKRIQAALHAQNEPDYDDDELPRFHRRKGGRGHHDEEITSSSPAPAPKASRVTSARLKAERMSQAPRSRQVSMIPNTQIMGVDEEEADEG